ncbi:MAG: ATPase, T2SS/T4P/T4SS family [Candidatus Caldarchaeales archaeon]
MAGQGQAQLPGLLSKYPHLREYLTAWQRSGRRPPVFVVQLSREMRDAEEVNVLYPIGDPFFVHVYSAEGPWRRYVVVQPRVEEGAWKALDYVDEAVAVRVLREGGRTEGEKEEVLRRLLEEVVASDPSVPRGEYRVVRKGGVVTEVRADPMLAAGIRHYVLMEKTAHGVIEPFIRDPYIEDISCDGVGPVFIVHRVFEGCVTNVSFRDERELDQFVLRLSIKCGRPVSFRNPIVDAQLPDGSRVNIVYGSDVSRRGSNFTIRKFSDTPISITQLIKWNVLSAEAAAYLWMLLESNMNVWFCGETASGKTTLLRAAAVFIRPTAKIVSIEDVPEIVVPHENWVSEVTKKGEAGTSGVELFDLLKAALRQRPNYIIVGEIRGQEASVAFQAMQCVEDAVVFAERGPVWLSELYAQHRSLGATDGDGSTYVEFPSPIGVYATAPGSREVWLAEAVGLRRLHSAETVRVTLSSGQVLRVTPNHRFILHPEGREVEASELLGLWRSGHRDLRLELRSPAGGGQMGPSSTALLPVGLGTFWYLVGRLIGGDYIASRGGRHELVSRVRGPGEAAELESIVNSVMACDGRSSARVRGSRTQLVFRGIRSELVHYLRSSGLLVSDGCRAWGALLSTDVGDGAALLKGILDALEGWGQRFQGPFGVVRASWTVWSLARLGLVEALRVRAGRGGGEGSRAC